MQGHRVTERKASRDRVPMRGTAKMSIIPYNVLKYSSKSSDAIGKQRTPEREKRESL